MLNQAVSDAICHTSANVGRHAGQLEAADDFFIDDERAHLDASTDVRVHIRTLIEAFTVTSANLWMAVGQTASVRLSYLSLRCLARHESVKVKQAPLPSLLTRPAGPCDRASASTGVARANAPHAQRFACCKTVRKRTCWSGRDHLIVRPAIHNAYLMGALVPAEGIALARHLLAHHDDPDPAVRARTAQLREHARELLPHAVACGVRVLAGTDAVATIATEIALLADCGLTDEQSLAAAGSTARDYLEFLAAPASVVIRGLRIA